MSLAPHTGVSQRKAASCTPKPRTTSNQNYNIKYGYHSQSVTITLVLSFYFQPLFVNYLMLGSLLPVLVLLSLLFGMFRYCYDL